MLLWALLAGFVLRLVPMLMWAQKPCVRDECTYQELAASMLSGDGMEGSHGWLWAPAYPALMALHGLVTGETATIQVTQLAVSVWALVLLYDLARGEFDMRTARWAVWIQALNPTHIFYTASLWSECLYSALLLASLLAVRWARQGGAARGWLPGVLVGGCVLFRGVATYVLPIYAIALLWGRVRERAAWRGMAACVVAAVLTVAPYSAYATQKFGGLIISDRTLGQMMWLGNNDFPPMTFDYGNGGNSDRIYDRVSKEGRDHCRYKRNPVRQDTCEVRNGTQWIRAHPTAFVTRMPERVAQLVNPHSFLTRHLRWGKWQGMPEWLDEALIVGVVHFSFLVLAGGTFGFFARARGWFAVASGLIVLYHVGAIALLAGLTRYRVPLEPLWTVYVAALIVAPRTALTALEDSRVRALAAMVVTAILLGLMLRFLPVGWPGWGPW